MSKSFHCTVLWLITKMKFWMSLYFQYLFNYLHQIELVNLLLDTTAEVISINNSHAFTLKKNFLILSDK